MNRTNTHLVLIPAFNPGRLLAETVRDALAQWGDVWVVVDGSTDASHERLCGAGLRVIVRPENGGKGAAVLTGARAALGEGFTHALVMDADGQHPADRIRRFMEASAAAPGAVVCGLPVFGPDAPRIRLYGRKLSVGLVRLETSGMGAADPLFGFRVYPLGPLVRALESTSGGTPAINIEAACRYVGRESGGVTHFHYVRDNLRMAAMHLRLILALTLGRRSPASP